MEAKRLHVGTKLIVSTDDGDQEDEVVRVLGGTPEDGLWVVQTARNGRVVVLRGRDDEWKVDWMVQ
jgi:hypothetical protein